ncbi:MAG TPA: cytochrome c maturation protein CcmE [Gammaproteobacteria bacterium]|jgi:cytochrome c-type biogenesis protein CcmE|nr:cytochrome c maturation protein CcmE [Gammaproteobacteria bacterium]
MTPRQKKRLAIVLVIVIGAAIATALGLRAFQNNILYYFTPSQVASGDAHDGQLFRMGGLVANGSVRRDPGSMTIHFTLTDMQHSVPIVYTGILPDLFREGQGIVVHGKLDKDGLFVADEVLAKHDEKYMPPEIAAAIKKAKAQQAAAAGSKG